MILYKFSGLFVAIQSTPKLYILDRNKKVIAKSLGVEQVPDFMKRYKNNS